MNEVYIDMRKENRWISQHFDKDLVSVEDLLRVIEDLTFEAEDLKERIDYLENRDDYDEHQDIPEIHGEGISW